MKPHELLAQQSKKTVVASGRSSTGRIGGFGRLARLFLGNTKFIVVSLTSISRQSGLFNFR